MRVVAIVAAPPGTDPTEVLRTAVALRAGGHAVVLAEAGRGAGALADAAPLSAPAERWLDELDEDGVPRLAAGDDLAGAIASADALLLLPDPARTGAPPLLPLRRGERPSPDAMAALLSAGQVVLE